MKLHLPAHRGFTLIEILIVIGILALLGVGMWQATAYVQNKGLRSTAEHQVQLLEASMNAYRADNAGVLPYARGDEQSSNIMYEALSRDEDNNGEPDDKNGEIQMPYCESFYIVSSKDEHVQEGIPVVKARLKSSGGGKGARGKVYVIMDPWGNAYRYRLGYECETDGGRSGDGMNPDFDIFSLGPDGRGNGRTNHGDNEDNISNVRSWK